MSARNEPERVRSLAATGTGERVEIRRILFDAVRVLCADLGVREGDVVQCRADTPSHLFLETPGGRTVTLERDWARFIQVAAAAGGAGRRVPVPDSLAVPGRVASPPAGAGGPPGAPLEPKPRPRRATRAEGAVTGGG